MTKTFIFTLFVLQTAFATCFIAQTPMPPPEWHLTRITEQVWVDPDSVPEYISSAQIASLIAYMSHVMRNDGTAPAPPQTTAVVFRFVPPDEQYTPFPVGCEGFAGLTDTAHWVCETSSSQTQRMCAFWDEEVGEQVTLSLVQVQSQPDLTLGYLVHEIAHALGAVDGIRCPAHEDYDPVHVFPPDVSDAYWWFGAVGVFELRPSGIVWDAMQHECAQSESPAICATIEIILSEKDAFAGQAA